MGRKINNNLFHLDKFDKLSEKDLGGKLSDSI